MKRINLTGLVQWRESVKRLVPINTLTFSSTFFVSFNGRYTFVYYLDTGIDSRE